MKFWNFELKEFRKEDRMMSSFRKEDRMIVSQATIMEKINWDIQIKLIPV